MLGKVKVLPISHKVETAASPDVRLDSGYTTIRHGAIADYVAVVFASVLVLDASPEFPVSKSHVGVEG